MNLAVLLENAAHRWPESEALAWGEATTSYRELTARTSAIASGLRAAGLVPGDRVAILSRNRPEVLEALWACFHGGFRRRPDQRASEPAGDAGAAR